jgi:ADP-heptose:LPS heptosyltransferase
MKSEPHTEFDHTQAKRILIYRLGSLGDTVVTLPCYHQIARTFPDAKRLLLTNFPVDAKAPDAAAVLGESGLVHGYLRYTVGTRNPAELLRLAIEIRRFDPDLLIYLMPERPWRYILQVRFFFRLAGVRRIVGLPAEEGRTSRPDPEHGLYPREASRLAAAIRTLGDADPENVANWDLCLTREEREDARLSLGSLTQFPLIACGPGTKMQAKDWGQENWRALIADLHATYPHHGLVLVGSRQEAEMAGFVGQDWKGPKINLCGQLTPRGTAAVLERAQVFLGPDSGPMHLAACVGVPCVIAFSAAGLPGAWFPIGDRHRIIYHRTSCHGCMLETCIEEARRCLTSISVAEMAAAVANVLGGPPQESTPAILQIHAQDPAHGG